MGKAGLGWSGLGGRFVGDTGATDTLGPKPTKHKIRIPIRPKTRNKFSQLTIFEFTICYYVVHEFFVFLPGPKLGGTARRK
jgi:hypothetical protein